MPNSPQALYGHPCHHWKVDMSNFMLYRAPFNTSPNHPTGPGHLSRPYRSIYIINGQTTALIPWDHPFILLSHTQAFPHYTNHWAYNNGSSIPIDEWTFMFGILLAFRLINSQPSWMTGISCLRLGISTSTIYSNMNVVIKALSQNFTLSATVITALLGIPPPPFGLFSLMHQMWQNKPSRLTIPKDVF